MGKLKDKVAVVTGAADGIGLAIAQRFAREGAKIAMIDIQEEKCAEEAKSIQSRGGEVRPITCDVGISENVSEAVDETIEHFSKIDIMCNNAAIALGVTITEMSEEDWNRVININLSSVYRGCKFVIPHMRKGNGGSIINIASAAAHVGLDTFSAYTAAKGAIISMTRQLAKEFAPENIRVNSISPGTINTPMNARLIAEPGGENLMESWKSMHPMERIGEPDEVAGVALFLASDDSSFVTGAELMVDGGLTINPGFTE